MATLKLVEKEIKWQNIDNEASPRRRVAERNFFGEANRHHFTAWGNRAPENLRQMGVASRCDTLASTIMVNDPSNVLPLMVNWRVIYPRSNRAPSRPIVRRYNDNRRASNR